MSCACLVISAATSHSTVYHSSGSCLIKSQTGEVLISCSEITHACFAEGTIECPLST